MIDFFSGWLNWKTNNLRIFKCDSCVTALNAFNVHWNIYFPKIEEIWLDEILGPPFPPTHRLTKLSHSKLQSIFRHIYSIVSLSHTTNVLLLYAGWCRRFAILAGLHVFLSNPTFPRPCSTSFFSISAWERTRPKREYERQRQNSIENPCKW